MRPRARRRPRVLRVITRMNIGGPARHVLLADHGLRTRGWQTLLAHGEVDAGEKEVSLDEGVDLPMVRVASLRRPIRPIDDARALASLVRLVRRYQPDIIHTHLSKAGLIGRLAAILAHPRARRVHTFHGTVFGNYFGAEATAAIVRAERFLGRHTDLILALSDAQRAELLTYGVAKPDRVAIVPLGLDLRRFGRLSRDEARSLLVIPSDQSVVIAAGRMVSIKRLDRLIDAFALVRRVCPAHLYLIGDGPERQALEVRAHAKGLEPHISFVGWVDEVANWYAAADVIALSSDREGTPLALIEAAAAARPVVASDVGGVADVVGDGETGYLVPPDDVAEFADRVVRLLVDPQLAQLLGRAAPARAERFAAERLIDDLDTTYRSMLGAARHQ